MQNRARTERLSELRFASRTDVGRVRSANEDSWGHFLRADGAQLFVVADGMGGHRGGATASREAVARIGAIFDQACPGSAESAVPAPAATLQRAVEAANRHVHALACADPSLSGMGTTIVALLIEANGDAALAHVGDSRAYRFRGRMLEALTTDHSVVAEMQRRGVLTAEEAAAHPRRNEILRSVGVLPEVDVELTPLRLAAEDWLLLCTDGLCGVVADAEIDLVLASSATPDSAAEALVALANECGGPDNVTVELISVPAPWPPAGETRDARSERDARAQPVADSDPSRPTAHAETPPRARRSVRSLALLGAVALLLVGAWWLLERV